MIVIAQRQDEEVFLIDLEQDDGKGYVYDKEEGVRYPPQHAESILARGYWIGIDHDPAILKEATRAEEVHIPGQLPPEIPKEGDE